MAWEEGSDASEKINIAGRQRMLSQKMAKAACFVGLGTNQEASLAEVQDAHASFGASLIALRDGDAEQGLLKEGHQSVIDSLNAVEEDWARYSTAISGVIENPGTASSQLPVIAELNLPVLAKSNAAVQEMERSYGGAGSVSEERARTINVAGKQRMLSQRAAKEFCFFAAGLEPEISRSRLVATVNEFDTAMSNLISGSGGLETPLPALVRDLERVQNIWADVRKEYQSVIDGATPTEEQIALVAERSPRLLNRMNRIVYVYSHLD